MHIELFVWYLYGIHNYLQCFMFIKIHNSCFQSLTIVDSYSASYVPCVSWKQFPQLPVYSGRHIDSVECTPKELFSWRTLYIPYVPPSLGEQASSNTENTGYCSTLEESQSPSISQTTDQRPESSLEQSNILTLMYLHSPIFNFNIDEPSEAIEEGFDILTLMYQN